MKLASLPLYNAVIPAPFGFLGLVWNPNEASGKATIEEICYLPRREANLGQEHELIPHLKRYLGDATTPLPPLLSERGTVFQRQVWAKIAAIPCGQVRSYGAIAAELGSGARAVGTACGRNPLPLLVPCHRVVASNSLGGFSGYGPRSDNHSGQAIGGAGFYLGVKRWLLAHEGVRL